MRRSVSAGTFMSSTLVTSTGGTGPQALDLQEAELEIVGIDHVVLHPLLPSVGHAARELRLSRAGRLLETQHTARQWHDHIVVRMHVKAGFRSGRETPLG